MNEKLVKELFDLQKCFECGVKLYCDLENCEKYCAVNSNHFYMDYCDSIILYTAFSNIFYTINCPGEFFDGSSVMNSIKFECPNSLQEIIDYINKKKKNSILE